MRVLRAETRKNQLDTAREAGLSLSRYWRIENGYNDPTPEERQKLARVLKVQESDAFPESAAS